MERFECPKIMEIEIKTELQEAFDAVEKFRTKETETVDPKEDCKPQRPYDGTEYSAAITQSSNDIPLRFLCRLCTIPDNNMADIFGLHATSRNILSMINHCLPVMIKETDTLPKRVCKSCLEELERCYRFHQTVAEAEKQLLAFCRLPSGNLEQMQRNFGTFARCDGGDGSTTRYNIDARLQTPSDVQMGNDASTKSLERATTVDTAVEKNVSLPSLRPCSVASVVEMGHENNSEANSREMSSINSDLTTDIFYSETISLRPPNKFGTGL